MSEAFNLRLQYFSGSIPSRVSAWIMEILPKCLLCIFSSISKSRMGRSLRGQQSLGYLWISRLRPLR